VPTGVMKYMVKGRRLGYYVTISQVFH